MIVVLVRGIGGSISKRNVGDEYVRDAEGGRANIFAG
jgi:hypothetical protein